MKNRVDWNSEKDNLIQLLVVEKLSYEKVGRKYQRSGSRIKTIAKNLGIDLPARRSINPRETFNKGKETGGGRGHKVCMECAITFSRKYYSDSISTEHFCSNKCRISFNKKAKYQHFLQHPEEYQSARYNPGCWIKPIIMEEQGHKCEICKIPLVWNGKPLVFVLDHIDGKASNNTRENLRLICSNCDSQLSTYKSKNKNGERKYYRIKKWN